MEVPRAAPARARTPPASRAGPHARPDQTASPESCPKSSLLIGHEAWLRSLAAPRLWARFAFPIGRRPNPAPSPEFLARRAKCVAPPYDKTASLAGASGSHRPARRSFALHQPGVVVGRVQRPRARRGARRAQSAARAPKVRGDLRDQPRRVLHDSGGGDQAADRGARRAPLGRRPHAGRAPFGDLRTLARPRCTRRCGCSTTIFCRRSSAKAFV